MRRLNLFSRRKWRRAKSRSWWSVPGSIGLRKNSPTGFRKLEQMMIRAVVLSAVVLVLIQMGLGLAKNPVDYYISVAQNVEAPSLDSTPVSSTVTPDLIQEIVSQTFQITLKADPAAPIRVAQNGKFLGTLARGELVIPIQVGNLQLDGTNVPTIVRVQVIEKAPELVEPRQNQTVMIEHNIQMLRVRR
ncbi:MAG: hypothetical protein AB7E31_02220 [Desulfitobacterium sp.]